MQRSIVGLAAVAMLLGAAEQASADHMLVTSRSALGSNDFVDWGVLGPPFTTVSNPFPITSNGGIDVTVSQPSGDFERRDQGDGWDGNFAPGTKLLWDQGNGPTVTLDFGLVGIQ